ncbi:hypothetical protein G7054_g13842 [Neopestalotiopsis clavispora]|nr:hypothetical protein G7054_g13842 [Neopestalotiopsis clavispora]
MASILDNAGICKNEWSTRGQKFDSRTKVQVRYLASSKQLPGGAEEMLVYERASTNQNDAPQPVWSPANSKRTQVPTH